MTLKRVKIVLKAIQEDVETPKIDWADNVREATGFEAHRERLQRERAHTQRALTTKPSQPPPPQTELLPLNGEIRHVKVSYENALPTAILQIYSSDNELMVSIEGNQDGVIRPRATTKTALATNLNSAQQEFYAEDRHLQFLFYNAGDQARVTVEVVYS